MGFYIDTENYQSQYTVSTYAWNLVFTKYELCPGANKQ